jgi:hypothetical protein
MRTPESEARAACRERKRAHEMGDAFDAGAQSVSGPFLRINHRVALSHTSPKINTLVDFLDTDIQYT